MTKESIVQIIPANPGFFALFEIKQEPCLIPVVCWGLRRVIEEELDNLKYEEIIGLILIKGTHTLQEVDDPALEGRFITYQQGWRLSKTKDTNHAR